MGLEYPGADCETTYAPGHSHKADARSAVNEIHELLLVREKKILLRIIPDGI